MVTCAVCACLCGLHRHIVVTLREEIRLFLQSGEPGCEVRFRVCEVGREQFTQRCLDLSAHVPHLCAPLRGLLDIMPALHAQTHHVWDSAAFPTASRVAQMGDVCLDARRTLHEIGVAHSKSDCTHTFSNGRFSVTCVSHFKVACNIPHPLLWGRRVCSSRMHIFSSTLGQ